MITEKELELLLAKPAIEAKLQDLKADFLKKEAQLLEISDHDFLALAILVPSLGLALANGTISLMEEQALNKKARRLSKGGYFLKRDPVVFAMKFLIKAYDKWELTFCTFLQEVLESTGHISQYYVDQDAAESPDFEADLAEMGFELMRLPYIVNQLTTAFFFNDSGEVLNERSIPQAEFQKLNDLGPKLGLDKLRYFKLLLATYEVK